MSVPENFDQLTTEQMGERFAGLDRLSAFDIVRLMNEQDREVPAAVERCLGPVAEAIERIADRMGAGGRLFYVGAGTSGRLGMLDAYECPPTFGTDPKQVQALLAGGPGAELQADESAEDDDARGASDLRARGLVPGDAVVGIAASGRTPYVIGALTYARGLGALAVAVSCTGNSAIGAVADIAVEVTVGPEVLAGSTRLKAGTAQKMVLNMISTGTMVRLGKVYRNYMVDMQATNGKLRMRARRIVMQAAGADEEAASGALRASGGDVKTAIVMLRGGLPVREASELLRQSGGRIREALQLAGVERGEDER